MEVASMHGLQSLVFMPQSLRLFLRARSSYKKAPYSFLSSAMVGFYTLPSEFLGDIWKPQFPHCNVSGSLITEHSVFS